jgi:hypothetical protein
VERDYVKNYVEFERLASLYERSLATTRLTAAFEVAEKLLTAAAGDDDFWKRAEEAREVASQGDLQELTEEKPDDFVTVEWEILERAGVPPGLAARSAVAAARRLTQYIEHRERVDEPTARNVVMEARDQLREALKEIEKDRQDGARTVSGAGAIQDALSGLLGSGVLAYRLPRWRKKPDSHLVIKRTRQLILAALCANGIVTVHENVANAAVVSPRHVAASVTTGLAEIGVDGWDTIKELRRRPT